MPAGFDIQDLPASVKDWVAAGRSFEFAGHEVFVHSSGPIGKEGVLVVHGYPGSSWDWNDVVPPISQQARIVVPDMIGYGQSDKPLDGTYKENFSLILQADMFEAVVADEGLDTVILFAHDWARASGWN